MFMLYKRWLNYIIYSRHFALYRQPGINQFLPPIPDNRSGAFKIGNLLGKLEQLQVSSKSNSTIFTNILDQIAGILNQPNGTITTIAQVTSILTRLENEEDALNLTIRKKVLSLFSIVNIIWLLAILEMIREEKKHVQLNKQQNYKLSNVADYIFNEFKTYKNLKIHHPQNLKSISSSSFIHRKQHRKAKHKSINNNLNRSIVKNIIIITGTHHGESIKLRR